MYSRSWIRDYSAAAVARAAELRTDRNGRCAVRFGPDANAPQALAFAGAFTDGRCKTFPLQLTREPLGVLAARKTSHLYRPA